MNARLAKIVMVLLTLTVLFFLPQRVQADTCTWNAYASGNWSDPTKWGCGFVPDLDDTAVINNGTVTLDGPVTVMGLTQTGGTLTGAQPITITGAFQWSGGAMSGTGATNIQASASPIQFTDSADMSLTNRIINNYGNATWNSAHRLYFYGTATFNNKNGAVFTTTVTGTNLFYSDSATNAFNNESGAIFRKDSSVDTTIDVYSFNNAGTLDLVKPGKLSLTTNSSTGTGAYQVNHASANLNFSQGTTNLSSTSSITGTGLVEFSFGTVNIDGAYNVTGGTTVSGGTVHFSSTSTVTSVGPVVISSGTLDLSSGEAISVPSLNQSGGYLDGTDTVTATSVTWSYGQMVGYGTTNVPEGGTLSITGPNSITLDTRIFNNSGNATWDKTTNMIFNGNATFNNKTGATFSVTQLPTSYLFYGYNTNNRFVNESGATFSKDVSGDTILHLDVFDNNGAVALTMPGAMALSTTTSTNAGAFQVSHAGAILRFSAGTFTLNATSSFTGAGTVDFDGGTATLNGSYNITGGTTASGGTVHFKSAITSLGAVNITSGVLDLATGSSISAPSLSVTGGDLDGPDALTATAITWSGGEMKGFGSTNVPAGGTLTITGTSTLSLTNRTFNNSGAATWDKTGYLYFSTGARFNNKNGATFTITQAGTSLFNKTGGNNQFTNEGGATFKMDAVNDTTLSIDVFDNAGTLVLTKGGMLILSATTSSGTGAYQVDDANAILRFSTGIYTLSAASNFTGIGTVEFYSGTANLSSTYNVTGGTKVSGGTVHFTASATVTSLGSVTITSGTLDLSSGEAISIPALLESGGTLTGSDSLTVTSITWTAGYMTGLGSTSVPAGGTLSFTGSGGIQLDTRTFNNGGTATWDKTGYMTIYANTTFNNQEGATFTVTNNGTYIFSRSGNNTTFNNAGTLNLRTGNFNVNHFIQTATGVTNFVISGPTHEADFCQFITTDVNLNGTVTITIPDFYHPIQGNSFVLMTYSAKTGAFSSVVFPALDPGNIWTSTYFTNQWVVKIGWPSYIPSIKKVP